MGGSPVGAGAVPTVTSLTLSSRSKASPFRIILWRCWAPSEHGIAHQNCASYWAGSAVTVPDNRCTTSAILTTPDRGQAVRGVSAAPIPDLPAKSTNQFEKRQRSHDT